jgi:hypothetical protein
MNKRLIGWSSLGIAALLVTIGGDRQPAQALDQTLHEIAARYGTRTVDFVALQLEYPRKRSPQ